MACECNKKINIDMVVRSPELTPKYATELDGAMDLCVDLGENVKPYSVLAIPAGHTIKVQTGVQVKLPKDYVMLLFPRSSTGIKLHCQLANSVGIIDAGYRDEVIVALHNYSEKAVYLTHGQRIAQFIVLPRPRVEINLVQDDELFRENDRLGGIGSTGL